MNVRTNATTDDDGMDWGWLGLIGLAGLAGLIRKSPERNKDLDDKKEMISLGILGGNSKDEPLHYGEIFDLWQFSMTAKGCISAYRAYSYHAGDKELKKILGELIDQAELEVSECDSILSHNGIASAPLFPARPEAKLEEIPIGARFTDPEIAAMLGANTSIGLVACSQIMGKAIREDIGMLFGKYHITKAAIGLKILRLSKEKGWLIPPPLQIKRPELVEA